jgi:hypothetical protein
MVDRKGLARRVSCRIASFVLYDLITGVTSYCVIALVALFLVSLLWIRITQQYAAVGMTIGSPFQLQLAWLGAIACLPVAGLVIYLAIFAFRIPIDVGRTGGRETLAQIRALFAARHRAHARPLRADR